MRQGRGKRTRLLTAVMLAATAVLSGCAAIPDSARPGACIPTDAYQVERTGDQHGPVVTDDGVAAFSIAVFDSNGTELQPAMPMVAAADGSSLPVDVAILSDLDLAPVQEIIRCAQGGQTLRATVPLTASATLAQHAEGAADTDNLIVEVNVERVYHSAATGRVVAPQAGIPAVVTAPDGTPGVTMPSAPAPTERRDATTVQGFGAPVQPGDTVTLQVSVHTWKSGRVLVSTWEAPSAAMQLVVGADDGLFGVSEQLIDAPVGSQRVVVVPAAQANTRPEILGVVVAEDDAAVFVIDVLGRE